MRLRVGRPLLAGLLVLLPVSGCTGSRAEAQFSPKLSWGSCPDDVELTFVSRHRCGRLTVLEDRARPEGPTLDLLVTQVWPTDGKTQPGVGLSFNQNVGEAHGPNGSMVYPANALGTSWVEMEARGAGPHNEPSLRCPEVGELRSRIAASLTGDQDVESAFVAAVGRCWDRLRESGVDPAAYDVAQSVADVEDLRAALHVDRWVGAGAYGSASRVARAYLDAHPDAVDKVYFDSPWPPDLDEVSGAVLGLRAQLHELFQSCAASPRCARMYPDLEHSWTDALARLAREPLQSRHTTLAGTRVDVTVDAGKLLRAARFALGGDGPSNLEQLPAMIDAASRGILHQTLAEIVASDPDLCFGYRPKCSGHDDFSLGVYLTAFCRDQVSLLDEERLAEAIDGDPLYDEVFGHSPYRAACDAWDVAPADAVRADRLPQGVPALMLHGQFDSFSPVGLFGAEASAGASEVTTLVVPAATHNVLGSHKCAIAARDAWVEDPGGVVPDDACADTRPVAWAH